MDATPAFDLNVARIYTARLRVLGTYRFDSKLNPPPAVSLLRDQAAVCTTTIGNNPDGRFGSVNRRRLAASFLL